MKKLLLLVVALSFVAVGCGSKEPESVPAMHACLVGAPDWVINGGVEGGLSGVGSAQIGKAGINFARTEALSVGRDEIARILSVKVNNMFKNFTQSTGIGDEETVDKVSANVSKQIASQMISGSKQMGSWVSPCNELYILVGIDAQMAQQAIKEQSISSFKNERALYQQFLAQKGQEELEEAIKNEFKAQ
ncbi:MAG: LPP20 family lipoprotein [Deferribacterales bacterium]|nr:LPP20 family lipoprotein [Deferribacterales bacterium]